MAESGFPGSSPLAHPTKKVPLITSQQIAWAAGIYEGEGFASIPTRSNRSERVEVTQKDRWLVDELQRLFGGTVRSQRQKEGSYWHWTLFGPRARGFLMTIYSFLSPRRRVHIQTVLRGRTDYIRGPRPRRVFVN